jgi:hypothetical protein
MVGLAVLETAIGSIPYVGCLYDLGQLLYSKMTGRNYWTGERVSTAELWLMGVFALLPMGISAVRAARRLAALARGTRPLEKALATAIGRASVEQIAATADPELVRAMATLSEEQQNLLVNTAEAVIARPRNAIDLLNQLEANIRVAYETNVANRELVRVLSGDFRSFRNPELAEAYQKYQSRGGPASVLEWMRRTRGAPRRAIIRELGEDFVEVLNRAARDSRIPELTPEARNLLDSSRPRGGVPSGMWENGTASGIHLFRCRRCSSGGGVSGEPSGRARTHARRIKPDARGRDTPRLGDFHS